jgi:hypothetical protein
LKIDVGSAKLTYQPVGANTTRCDNNESKTEDCIESNSLPSWHIVVPGDDARQRDRIEIADSRDHSSYCVHNIAVIEASIILCESELDVESHPVSPGRLTVQQQHNTEDDGVGDGEPDSEPDAPVPFLRVSACDKAAIEEQDRHLSTSAADQKRELREPHAKHGV